MSFRLGGHKLVREITSAARLGWGEGSDLEPFTYDGYGVGGVAVMVECMTANRNCTGSDVRHGFTKFGDNLGTTGSIGYLFTKQGLISFMPDESGNISVDEETAMNIALEAGADDVVVNDDGSIDVTTAPENFVAVVDAFAAQNISPSSAEVTMTPSTETALDKETAEKFIRMIDLFEDLDDVQNVYHNAQIPDDLEMYLILISKYSCASRMNFIYPCGHNENAVA